MKYVHNGDDPPYLDYGDELEARRSEYSAALEKAEAAFDKASIAMADAQEKFNVVQRSWKGNDRFLPVNVSDLERTACNFLDAVETFKVESENEREKYDDWNSFKRH